MALFSKPLPKKHPPGSQDAKRAQQAADAAASGKAASGGITITGFGAIDWSPTRRKIEVTQGHAGMCAILENAVLLYASGHAEQARVLLDKGVQEDDEAKRSALAWLALFDLLQRAGDHAAFEKLAMLYVVLFERSAPAWEARAPTSPEPRPSSGGYIAVTGKLTAANRAQFDALKRAMLRDDTQARFDLAAVSDFDDAGARGLADVLAEARRRQYPLRVQRPERLRRVLEGAVAKGSAGGEGAWLLSLELMQWANDRAAFDDRAVEYAVTFEVSPPSWEPPDTRPSDAELAAEASAALAAADEAVEAGVAARTEMLEWSGVLAGPHSPQVVALADFASMRHVVPIDMSDVDRIDFVCAGSILNAVNALESQRKVVHIFGATPIIRGILLLIGVSPGHFVKKAL